ncbi:MAG TPA: delta-60 repeat domain-containing protein [Nocardioidaceae bacterium]|nr:delta-60 repeat domain-containing protein [Nocardioidaceae bacterium]
MVRKRLAPLSAATALTVALPGLAYASVSTTPDPSPVVAGGVVYSIAKVGTSTVLGGTFTSVAGVARDGVAVIDTQGKLVTTVNPDLPDGFVVYAVEGSSDGSTIYIGGTFASVDGMARSNLAAIDVATGALKASWSADTNDVVRTMEVKNDRLYVGGSFTSIDGVSRRRLVALTTDGNVITAFNPWPNWTVRDVAVSPDGTRIYAVGSFAQIGGQTRKYAAELSATDGKATTFAPSTDGGVAIAAGLSPDGTRFLYATENNSVFAYDPATSNDPAWVNKGGGDTQAIAMGASGEVYIGGHFTIITDQFGVKTKREKIASIWLADGTVTGWNPALTGNLGPWSILTAGSRVEVAGDYQWIGGKKRGGFARFSGTP